MPVHDGHVVTGGITGRACGDRANQYGLVGTGGIAGRECGGRASQDGHVGTGTMEQGTLQGFSGILESTAQNDFEDEGRTPAGKRKRPMCAGVVLGDIETRVSDILPEPSPLPSDVSESRKKFIKGLCTIRGGVSPQVVEAMKLFYNIQNNVSRKDVDTKLREAGHFLDEKDVTTMYNKIKSAFNNHLK